MADTFKTKTMGRKNKKGLALSAPPPKPAPSAGDAQIPGAIGNDDNRTDTLEIGVEFRLDLKAEDLIVLRELGSGNGGTVSKVQHAATKVIMARKVGNSGLVVARAMVDIWADHTRRGKKRSAETDRA
jgi:mitogen-activated protein kinase kinase